MNRPLVKRGHGNSVGDCFLWHDGTITVRGANIYDYLSVLDKVFVDALTDDIMLFNQYCRSSERICIKERLVIADVAYTVDTSSIDEREIIVDALDREFKNNRYTECERYSRIARTYKEYSEYHKNNLCGFLRLMIYIVNKLKESGAVWGVGRGSSVASYILYLLDIHMIDSVRYELDFSDFLKK